MVIKNVLSGYIFNSKKFNEVDKYKENKNQFNCPYCYETVVIEEQGVYLCDDCKMKYTYNNGLIKKADTQLSLYYLFAMLAKFSKANGIITKKHINIIEKIITDVFRYENEERQQVINYFRYGKESKEGFNKICIKFHDIKEDENPNGNEILYKAVIDFLYQILVAEEQWTSEQDKMLNLAIAIFGLDKKTVRNIESKYMNTKHDELEDYLKVLNCSKGASLEEIKSNYRKLVHEYHPDKYASLPKFIIDYVTEKFQELQEAYEYVQAMYSKSVNY